MTPSSSNDSGLRDNHTRGSVADFLLAKSQPGSKLSIGSGVIEAGYRSVIGKRCKQSGMHRGEAGAEKVLAFRCIHASRNLDLFWKYRLNSRSPENDSLPLAA